MQEGILSTSAGLGSSKFKVAMGTGSYISLRLRLCCLEQNYFFFCPWHLETQSLTYALSKAFPGGSLLPSVLWHKWSQDLCVESQDLRG